MSKENAAFIKSESHRLGLSNVVPVRDNVFDFLPICHEKFDIVFADPPYAIEGLDTIPDKVLEHGIINPDGYLILEHPDTYSFQDHPCFRKRKALRASPFHFF
jgi:16S rRNA (guanine966-N2)-methyltransferase